jgi:regulator of protease activity HflC (stomatin/prohibitin superfamily)
MEKTYKASPKSGYWHIFVNMVILALIIYSITIENFWMLLLALPWFLHLTGFMVIQPNKAGVMVLFGEYKGSIKQNGFFWINPFMVKKKISLRANNLDSKPIKVNDNLGNPIMIGVVLVWRVRDTYKAFFDVENYADFVHIQTDAAIRKLAGAYPYDSFDDNDSDICLRSDLEDVNGVLETEMTERLALAGIEVIEARISHLAYAQEIAGAMLQRQQATAIIAARRKIVEGAVGMVEMALDELNKKEVVELDEHKKATMISNLMVVLCSDKSASPVVNTGTLYQ